MGCSHKDCAEGFMSHDCCLSGKGPIHRAESQGITESCQGLTPSTPGRGSLASSGQGQVRWIQACSTQLPSHLCQSWELWDYPRGRVANQAVPLTGLNSYCVYPWVEGLGQRKSVQSQHFPSCFWYRQLV